MLETKYLYSIIGFLFLLNLSVVGFFIRYYLNKRDKELEGIEFDIGKEVKNRETNITSLENKLLETIKYSIDEHCNNEDKSCDQCKKATNEKIKALFNNDESLFKYKDKFIQEVSRLDERVKSNNNRINKLEE